MKCDVIAQVRHYHSMGKFSRQKISLFFFFFFFPQKKHDLTFYANFLLLRQFAWNVKAYFLEKIRKILQNIVCWSLYAACWTLGNFPVIWFLLHSVEHSKFFYNHKNTYIAEWGIEIENTKQLWQVNGEPNEFTVAWAIVITVCLLSVCLHLYMTSLKWWADFHKLHLEFLGFHYENMPIQIYGKN